MYPFLSSGAWKRLDEEIFPFNAPDLTHCEIADRPKRDHLFSCLAAGTHAYNVSDEGRVPAVLAVALHANLDVSVALSLQSFRRQQAISIKIGHSLTDRKVAIDDVKATLGRDEQGRGWWKFWDEAMRENLATKFPELTDNPKIAILAHAVATLDAMDKYQISRDMQQAAAAAIRTWLPALPGQPFHRTPRLQAAQYSLGGYLNERLQKMKL